jgi:hypothetical protein
MTNRSPVLEVLDPVTVEILRKMTPEQRLKQAFAMWETAKTLTRGVLRQEHPDWTEERVQRELARRPSRGAIDRIPSDWWQSHKVEDSLIQPSSSGSQQD